MAVFRIEKTRDYTVMSNHHLKNKNLSLKAKGLMSLLLSLPDNPTRERALDIIIERHLTVSEAERLINDIIRRKKEPTRAPIRVFKDMRIFINTLNHAVDSIRRAGIEADTAKSETDEYFEYVVRISKPCSKNVTTQVVDV
jgi:ParB family chromosome partitioning protein